MEQLLCHLVGDYLLQSDWMANEKTKRWTPAIAHALCYTAVFCFITQSPVALGFIFCTHLLIDRFRLARYVCWIKNFLAPSETTSSDSHGGSRVTTPWHHPWSECRNTGYHMDRPAWMSVWLMIIADNTLHMVSNYVALRWL